MCVQEGEDRAIYGVRCWAITVTTFGVLSLLLVILSIVQGNLDWISGLSFLGAPAMIIGGATLTCCVAPITKMKTSISMGCAVIGIIVPLVQAAGGAARFAQIDALIGNAVATATANGNAASIQLAQIRTFITIFLIVGISIAVLLAGLNGPHNCSPPSSSCALRAPTLRHSRCVTHAPRHSHAPSPSCAAPPSRSHLSRLHRQGAQEPIYRRRLVRRRRPRHLVPPKWRPHGATGPPLNPPLLLVLRRTRSVHAACVQCTTRLRPQ